MPKLWLWAHTGESREEKEGHRNKTGPEQYCHWGRRRGNRSNKYLSFTPPSLGDSSSHPTFHAWWRAGTVVVFGCSVLLNNTNNYFINSVQTAAGQKGAPPSWTRLTNLLHKLQTTKSVETQSIWNFLNSKQFSPAHPVLLQTLQRPSDWCLYSTSPPSQATAEKL